MKISKHLGRPADVCFILEGTWPYVPGGVSSWVAQVLAAMPDYTFAIFYLGGKKDDWSKLAYEVPDNVTFYEEVFIFDELPESEKTPGKINAEERHWVYKLIRDFHFAKNIDVKLEKFWETMEYIDGLGDKFTFGNFCEDQESWDLLVEVYSKYLPNESFIDFFYATRFLHLPFWKAMKGMALIPPARTYHAVCTGYAGFMAGYAAKKNDARSFLTEHGIYAKERIAEINRAGWIYDPSSELVDLSQNMSKLKLMWIEMFKFFGVVSYYEMDIISTLYMGNKALQIEYGAPADKIIIIPNGIRIEPYEEARTLRAERLKQECQIRTIGFVGRVVPIKDVKTLIRAMVIVAHKFPDVLLKIIGPIEEEASYARDCRELVSMNDLDGNVEFMGKQDVTKVLADVDVLVLTSISEGLPFVILEANAAEIPCVVTDVGACRELIYGNNPEDRAIGQSGILTKISSPELTANALMQLLGDIELTQRYGLAGFERLRQFYTEKAVMDRYFEIYSLEDQWQE